MQSDIELSAITDFVTLLSRRACHAHGKTALTYLPDGENESGRETFGELDSRARAVARYLNQSCAPGDRVILLSETGPEFVAAFLGCLYARLIAVPCHAPRANQGLERLNLIAVDCKPKAIIPPSRVLRRIETTFRTWPALAQLRCIGIEEAVTLSDRDPATDIDPDSIAFLQYTSGSTGNPKGVAVSHRNLIENERAIREAFLHSPESVVVGWLPLFHDMGLIGNLLQPLYAGATAVLMPPVAAIQKPMRVIKAISKYRATSCGGPNSFFDLCARKFSRDELETDGRLDLSSWIRAYNGSEPVRGETIDAFCTLYRPYGFRRSSFYPCYGLAEATLFVSGGKAVREPTVLRLRKDRLEQHRVEIAGPNDVAVAAVSCGPPGSSHRVAIVNPDTGSVYGTDQIGEIWVSGPSVARGYWGETGSTSLVFGARLPGEEGAAYLRTGDLGFVHDGELIVTGRSKDLIIVHGRNHYPQDIERTVEMSHPALRSGCGAAFTVPQGTEEQLCVVHEVKREALRRMVEGEVVDAARQAVARMHDLRLEKLVLVLPGTVARTSSGKIRRHACRQAYLEGTLSRVGTYGSRPTANVEA